MLDANKCAVRRRRHALFARVLLVAACGCALRSTVLTAQTSKRTPAAPQSGWTLVGDVAGVLRGTWLSSTTAPTVESDVGVSLAVGAQRALSARTRGGIAVRVQSQPLRLSESGERWDGGTLTVGDVVGLLVLPGVRAAGMQSEVEISSGLSLLTGARNIFPFSSAGMLTPLVGVGAVVFRATDRATDRASDRAVRTPTRRLNVIVRYDLIRLDPGPTLAGSLDTFAGTAGWASRISAGLRVHR